MNKDALQIALDYANQGIPVFPCGDNKKPLVQGGFKSASTDAAQITKWWTAYKGAMIGIPTGQASGLVVIDVDVKDDVDGFQSLKSLEPLPKTLMVTTPSGGAHFIFKHDPARPLRNSASQLGDGLDIRGDGGYIIAAGSSTSSGAYEVTRDLPIAPCPAWIGDVLASKKSNHAAPANDHALPANDAYIQKAIHGEIGKLAVASAGQRNEALNRAAFSLGTLVAGGGLAEQDAHRVLLNGATACGLLADDGAHSVQATIRSGLSAGKANPRQLPERSIGPTGRASGPSKGPEENQTDERPKIVAKPAEWIDWHTIPPRKWIYDKFLIRGYVSLTVATGGVGKSMLSIVEAISVATGRALLEKPVYERANAWVFNLEDSQEELNRRRMAAYKRHGITRDEIAGSLFVNSGLDSPLVIAMQPRDGLQICAPVVEDLIEQIKANEIGLLTIDPFVSSHQVNENDNGAIDAVAKKWAYIANQTGCAIHLIHHSRKTVGTGDIDVEDARGASALLATARAARVLNPMSASDAQEASIPDSRFQYVKIMDGKANLSPMSSKADWFKLDSVSLENGDQTGNLKMLQDDWVGVPVAWAWPETQGLDDDERGMVLEHLTLNGPWREDMQAAQWAGYGVLDALGLDHKDKAAKARASKIIKDMIKSENLETYIDKDKKREDKKFLRVVDHAAPL
jgi:hypothetical protein